MIVFYYFPNFHLETLPSTPALTINDSEQLPRSKLTGERWYLKAKRGDEPTIVSHINMAQSMEADTTVLGP